jgi:hypothetical protein
MSELLLVTRLQPKPALNKSTQVGDVVDDPQNSNFVGVIAGEEDVVERIFPMMSLNCESWLRKKTSRITHLFKNAPCC